MPIRDDPIQAQALNAMASRKFSAERISAHFEQINTSAQPLAKPAMAGIIGGVAIDNAGIIKQHVEMA